MECVFLVLGDSTNILEGWMSKLPSGLGGRLSFASWLDDEEDGARKNGPA